MPKTEIPHVGWWGVFSDPTGNRIALYTSMRH
jgi:predicted enzyme related to lactoylglutathione lyase